MNNRIPSFAWALGIYISDKAEDEIEQISNIDQEQQLETDTDQDIILPPNDNMDKYPNNEVIIEEIQGNRDIKNGVDNGLAAMKADDIVSEGFLQKNI